MNAGESAESGSMPITSESPDASTPEPSKACLRTTSEGALMGIMLPAHTRRRGGVQ